MLIWGDETFLDGVDILPDEFYKRLATSKVMPTTSQVAIVTMKAAFEKLLAEGYYVLGIFISAKLSGTVQSATQARDAAEAADKIAIVDSNSTAMAMGFHVLTVARALRRGPISLSARNWRKNAVSTPASIRRGSPGVSAPRRAHWRCTGPDGHRLNIKPVLELWDGRINRLKEYAPSAKPWTA